MGGIGFGLGRASCWGLSLAATATVGAHCSCVSGFEWVAHNLVSDSFFGHLSTGILPIHATPMIAPWLNVPNDGEGQGRGHGRMGRIQGVESD